MDTERRPLSCPGRVQDWLGSAAEQIGVLLDVPIPSLSGSDLAIGALRIKRERPSRKTGPYHSRRTNLVSGAFPSTCRVPPSVSSDRLLGGKKSPGRCENCVAGKRSRCSRNLPSCTRCRKKGLLCLYAEGAPTGRRKLQRTRVRSRIKDGEPGLRLESFLTVPASEDPALLDTEEILATRHYHPEVHSPHGVSEHPRSSLDKYTAASAAGSLMDPLPARSSENSQYRTVVVNQWVTDVSPHRTSEVETVLGFVTAESPQSQWGGSVTGPDLMQRIDLQRDSGSEEERKILESAVQTCVDSEIQKPPAYLIALPSQSRIPFRRQIGAVSLITTPSASTLVSRSTSRSSRTDSLPITPPNEIPTPLNGIDPRRGDGAKILASQVAPAFHGTLHKGSTIDNMEVHPLQMARLGDLHFPHHLPQTPCCAMPSPDAQDESLPDGFIEELFAEGDAAKGLVELQHNSPKKKVFLKT